MQQNFDIQNISPENIRQAIFDRIRYQSEFPARRMAQNIQTSGIRTSGVSLLPMREAARQRASGEAQAVIGLGQQQLGQKFAAAESERERQSRSQLAKYGWAQQQSLAATQARQRMQQALLSGLISGGASLATAGLSGAAGAASGPSKLQKLLASGAVRQPRTGQYTYL